MQLGFDQCRATCLGGFPKGFIDAFLIGQLFGSPEVEQQMRSRRAKGLRDFGHGEDVKI
ncbi:hypothetical protein [Sinorhizobium sp. A49]|uniref:hypothetical protein n=1 Tax=Sinorhizobium sp. A49 TaxID=1945861 RepID=UPI001FD89BAB|nr:hypothetical protein [Sinorhizobium sp. A49]